MARLPKLEVYRSRMDGQWYWRLVASNGQTVAVGEGYRRKIDLLRTTARYLTAHDVVVLPELPDRP